MKTKLVILLKLVVLVSFAFYYAHSVQNLFERERVSTDVSVFEGTSIRFIEHIIKASKTHRINPALIAAVIAAESNFKPNAHSYAGAKGLMQINDITARYLKVKNVYDPKTNIEAGTSYLSELSDKFGGDVRLILAAYNAGPGAVKKFGGVPPYKETRKYIQKVMNFFHLYQTHPDLNEYI